MYIEVASTRLEYVRRIQVDLAFEPDLTLVDLLQPGRVIGWIWEFIDCEPPRVAVGLVGGFGPSTFLAAPGLNASHVGQQAALCDDRETVELVAPILSGPAT